MSIKTLTRIICVALFFCLAGAADRAFGQLLAYEGFDYSTGSSLYGLGGGNSFGFSAAWDPRGAAVPQYHIGDATLHDATGTLPSNYNCCTVATPSPAWTCATRNLTTPLGTPGTHAYFSCLLRPEGQLGTGDAGGYYGMYLYSSTQSSYLFFGKPGAIQNGGNLYDLEVVGGAGPCYTNTTLAVGRTDLLVLRVDFAKGADTVRMYVNPTPGQPEPLMADAIKTDFDLGTVTAPGIFSSGTFSIDEIRVGRSFADVTPATVPEPASLALLLTACLCGILWWRRKR